MSSSTKHTHTHTQTPTNIPSGDPHFTMLLPFNGRCSTTVRRCSISLPVCPDAERHATYDTNYGTLTLIPFSRYFILTRDYLNCFKRATGSASEKISDMGQFIFKVSFWCWSGDVVLNIQFQALHMVIKVYVCVF